MPGTPTPKRKSNSPFTGPDSFPNAITPADLAALKAAQIAAVAAFEGDDTEELEESDEEDELDEPTPSASDSGFQPAADDDPHQLEFAKEFWLRQNSELPKVGHSPTSVPQEFYDLFQNRDPNAPDAGFGPRLHLHHGKLMYSPILRAQYKYRLNINTLAFGALPPEDQPWVVHRLIRAGEITLVVGDSAAKKSFLLQHLAMHVSYGLPWLGRPVLATPVLYFENDLGHDVCHHRLTLLQRGINREGTPCIAFASFARWNFPAPEEADLLTYAAFRHDAGLIIFDPLPHLGQLGLENDLHALQKTITLLRGVAVDLGIAIVLVHHLNKRGHYRGVSHLKSIVDTMLLVQSNPHTPIVHAETPKTRSAPGQRFAARFHVEPATSDPDLIQFHLLTDTDSTFAASRNSQSVPTQILNHLILHGPATRRALIAALPSIQPNTLKVNLARLSRQQQISRHKKHYAVSP